jgi:uncharacterized phage protein gp47/JayE
MPDTLPAEFSVPTRDETIALYKRAYKLRVKDADTRDGTQVDIDARVLADALTPVYAAAKTISRNSVLEEATGDAVAQWCEREGVQPPKDAVGSSGYVVIAASSGGTTIQNNDELIHEPSAMLFRAVTSGAGELKLPGSTLTIVGKSTGSATNLPANTQLKWTSPRPGCSPYATVYEQSNGDGLTGGREKETDEEAVDRVIEQKKNPRASGNDNEYQQTAEETPTVAVQKAFTYPAVQGSSTTCVVFTMRPLRAGASRVPGSAQISLVEAYVVGEMPGDDGPMLGALLEESATVVYGVNWSDVVTGWTDVAPWPPYKELDPDSGSGSAVIQSAASSTSFIVKCANDDYTTMPAPVAGKTVGLYDAANYTFRRKRILSVSGSGPWTITVDSTNNASDTSFTPAVSDRVMPWSDSLSELLADIYKYNDTLGPGEQVSSFYDSGTRQRRQPRPAKGSWPSELTTKGLVDAITTDVVDDVTPLEGSGTTPSVGVPGVSSYILRINKIALFPDL